METGGDSGYSHDSYRENFYILRHKNDRSRSHKRFRKSVVRKALDELVAYVRATPGEEVYRRLYTRPRLYSHSLSLYVSSAPRKVNEDEADGTEMSESFWGSEESFEPSDSEEEVGEGQEDDEEEGVATADREAAFI